MAQPIFRAQALAKLSSPEQLDQLVRLTTPRSWLVLAGLGLLLSFLVGWGIFGTVAVTVPGEGVLLHVGGVNTVRSTQTGLIAELTVGLGENVSVGQTIARLTPENSASGDPSYAATSPYVGRVVGLAVTPGQLVERGAPLILVEPSTRSLEAVLFLPLATGKNITPGMSVLLSPSTAQKEAYGYLLGTVTQVSDFPQDEAALISQLGNAALAQTFLAQGAVLAVRVALIPDVYTISGYRWSERGGPPQALSSGTLCQATLIVRQQRPLSLLLPFFNP